MNVNGNNAGRVVDFGVTSSKGAITYAVFAPSLGNTSDDGLYPIPLAAFVVPEEPIKWILELPEDILANTPTFKKNPWPNRVPLAWTEYVNVRYGRSPSGGVQSERARSEGQVGAIQNQLLNDRCFVRPR